LTSSTSEPSSASFEAFGFATTYQLEVDPEFPGDGDWHCPVVGFDRSGRPMPEFDSRWGTPFIARIDPGKGEEWVAMFAAGGLGSLRGAFATPSPDLACIVVDGLAYLVDTTSPTTSAKTVHDQVHQVVACTEPRLLLLARFIDLVAVGSTGVAWSTPRLCVDDLSIIRADRSGIVCACDNLGGTPTITLDPATGAQIDGTRLDSFWPPDALA
jgi:hypothetical protein